MKSMDSDSNTSTDSSSRELPPNAFRSTNLEFIGYNPKDHDEFFNSVQRHSSSIINLCASTPRPMDLNFTSDVAKYLQRNSHLFVIIYGLDEGTDEMVPFGTLFLETSHRDMAHHRCSKLGIGILKRYQHHEAEAINWALEWAFNSVGLHRVEMNVLSWNVRVSVLCHRLGFFLEGRRRECHYKDGEWWDEINMSILKNEWRQVQCNTENQSS
ncbi:Acyl-CoA N-acyltransferase [Penicillium griseofulvum]|uniref:Acyl-CoA N-acyltransferase n=1 Tax=Penicillium patulum TaxID=5078 RepID=A0A135LEY9_PENPA|nr:Acyl-CoA N-acyltransferase [Penicillium griseofulvum]KXG47509.1 Acyl-CoA N-acyltransferase [Penicillium griseofulvum]